MKSIARITALSLYVGLIAFTAHAGIKSRVKAYTESASNPLLDPNNPQLTKDQRSYAENYRKRIQDAVQIEGFSFGGKKEKRQIVEAPGFISARSVPTSAVVAGPISVTNSIRINDLIYLRWTASTNPKEGEIYATVTPALVLQNQEDPTDFEIGLPKNIDELPKGYQQAGYLYETTGLIRITQISQGMVEARVINLRGQVMIGDRVMPPMPVYQSVPPVFDKEDLTAVIVAGHPVDRLSTTMGSILYINRGMRDGVKLGQIFTAFEGLKLDSPVHEAPRKYLGTVKVIYVSDAFSTTVVTEQFDIIRLGGLLRSAAAARSPRESTQENLSNMEALPAEPGMTLNSMEEPMAAETPSAAKPMSELDQLEKSVKDGRLTHDERERLNELHLQATGKQKDATPSDGDELPPEASDSPGIPELPMMENSFRAQPAAKKKKDAKSEKNKKRRDEERLNEMMQTN